MKTQKIFYGMLVLLLAGCAAIKQAGATVSDGTISNPSLGFFGFSFAVPDGFELYDPATDVPTEYGDLQQMVIRIYDLNESYHPAGNETFYESFLMFSEHTAFLLVTVLNDRLTPLDTEWADNEIAMQRQLLPMYNASRTERMTVGDSRLEALKISGQAYERKGWYYADPKHGRTEFRYEACRISGVNRDSYILMGFCLPEHEHILSLQMQELMRGFRF